MSRSDDKTARSTRTQGLPTEAPDPGSRSNGTNDDLDRVREILFGHTARLHAARMDALDAALESGLGTLRGSLESEVTELRRALQARIDGLDRDVHAELAGLREALDTERDERGADRESVAARIARVESDFATRLAALGGETRESFEKLASRLTRENAELREELAKRSHELTSNKADKGMLSDLLADLAARVKGAESGESGGARGRNS